MKVLSVWTAILIFSFVVTHSLEAKVFKWVDENGLTHYSDRPAKKLNKVEKLKKVKARVSLPPTDTPKKIQQMKSDREDFGEARMKMINLRGRINSLKGSINTLKGRINSLSGRVNTLRGRINTCQNLPEKIEFCEPHTCEISHSSVDSFVISHSISGMVRNNCHYEQTMPNNGLMTCNFSPWQRKQYGRLKGDMFSGHNNKSEPSVDMEASLKMDSMEENKSPSRVMEEKISNQLNGYETVKLFNEAIENGNCMITGY